TPSTSEGTTNGGAEVNAPVDGPSPATSPAALEAHDGAGENIATPAPLGADADAITMRLTRSTLDLGKQRVFTAGRASRSAMAQHTVGGRVLRPTLDAMERATAEGPKPVRLDVASDVPIWFLTMIVETLFWDARVPFVELNTGARRVLVRRPAPRCADVPPCAEAGIVLSDRGVLVESVAASPHGAPPCGRAAVAWDGARVAADGAATCVSYGGAAEPNARRELFRRATEPAKACAFTVLYGLDDVPWSKALDALDTAGEAPTILLARLPLPDGCEPEPSRSERVEP
ncbi:MAG: hypothetical protein KC417_12720, partial [Myxococcales bacterium]|nr:hypothetical protein [Myxococcales bacterium]